MQSPEFEHQFHKKKDKKGENFWKKTGAKLKKLLTVKYRTSAKESQYWTLY
jgi:hypothetical protein